MYVSYNVSDNFYICQHFRTFYFRIDGYKEFYLYLN